VPVEPKRFRIAIGALLFEGNTLSPVVSEIADFENKYLVSGPAMRERLRESDTEMGGAIQTLELYRDRAEIVPLVATHGGAGGRVRAPAYDALRTMLLEPLRAAGRVDGLYLALHGAFIAQGTDDMEGDVLADAGDCVGGGATGDSALVLAPLLEAAPDARATMCIVDPETVTEATRVGPGRSFQARIGNKRDPRYGRPVEAEAEVIRLLDGSFTYSGGILGGVSASTGASAVLQVGAVQVVVASESSYEYADEQFRAAGVDVWSCKFVVVKNPMDFQQAYAGAAALISLDTPGPTTADLAAPAWSAMSRPLHPLDDGFEPEVEGC
jgi:microcystin degradation protein MlrC